MGADLVLNELADILAEIEVAETPLNVVRHRFDQNLRSLTEFICSDTAKLLQQEA